MQISREVALNRLDFKALKRGDGLRLVAVLVMVAGIRRSFVANLNKGLRVEQALLDCSSLRRLAFAHRAWARIRKVNGLKDPAPCVGAGDHNNTKFNPVFRGMVRSRGRH